MSLAAMSNLFAKVTMRTVGAQSCRRVMLSTKHNDRYYTKRHEWISMDLFNQTGAVGISNYAQEALGQIVVAQLPVLGIHVVAGEKCAALEAAIGLVGLNTPVSGLITEKNTRVESDPTLINSSCYEDGWLFRMRVANLEELRGLMDQATYDEYIEENTQCSP